MVETVVGFAVIAGLVFVFGKYWIVPCFKWGYQRDQKKRQK